MENLMILKAIENGLITFSGLWSSWSERYHHHGSALIDTDVFDAILTAKPEWLEDSDLGYEINDWLCIRDYVADVFIFEATLLGMAIAYDDIPAQEVIRKHYRLLQKKENPVAKIGNNKQTVYIDADTLIKIKAVLDDKESVAKTETLTQILVEAGAYVIKTAEQILAERHWFTPEVMVQMKKIWENRWFLRETAGPKEIPHCCITKENVGMSLSSGFDSFNLKADFFSAEKIIIQQQDSAFNLWCDEPLNLASLWPDRQVVVAVNPKDKKVLGFAPIFVVHTQEKGFFTRDADEFEIFVKEFHAYYDEERKASAVLSFAQTSLSLLFWLKNHCS